MKRYGEINGVNWYFPGYTLQQLEEELLELEVKMLGHVTKEHVRKWISEGRFLTGRQVAQAGLAELIEL